MGIHDAGRLPDLADDQRQLFIGNSTHFNPSVKQIVRREFGGDPPENDIQVVKSFVDPRDCAGGAIKTAISNGFGRPC